MFVHWIAVLMFVVLVGAGKHEDRLISDIFLRRNYSSLARPVEKEGDAVDVLFGVTLQSIINVDEKKETLVSRLWLNYQWKDYKLRWDPEEYGGVDNIRVPWDKLWTPDILLYNSADEDIDSKFPVNIIVNFDGNLKWIPLGIYVSSCSIDIKWFPFDEQICRLKFGSWTYDGTLINLINATDAMETHEYQMNGEWDLIGAPAKLTYFFYDCCPDNPYIDISYYLHIRRRYLYYGSNLIIPCALISSLSVFTFALPPDTNAKVSLGITILLALSVFQLIVAEMVPSTSLSVPLIGIYFAFLMVMCTISLIITIIVINFHHRKPEMTKISPFIDKYINNYLAWFLCMKRPGRKPKSPFSKSNEGLKPINLETTKFMVPSLPHPNSPNTRFSSYLTSQHTRINSNLNVQNGARHRTINPGKLPLKDDTSGPTVKGSLLKLKNELGAILTELKFITTQAKENDAASTEVNDWKFAAMVIDRFCFLMFSIILVVGTGAIFLSSPNLRRSLGMS